MTSPATYIHNSNWLFQESKGTRWTHQENKQFEKALAYFDTDTPDKWFKVAALIPGKTVADVIKHYRELEEDICDIEAGFIPASPAYATTNPNHIQHSFTLDWIGDNFIDHVNQLYGKQGASGRSSDHDRKKGIPWTEEEHRQFLTGLKKYGKGDWRNISRYFVTTRTPTQVASHAQKYFIRHRQLNGDKDKRRSSIHDITTVHLPDNDSDPVPSSLDNKHQSPNEDKQQQQQEMLGWSHTNTNPDSFLQISPLGIKFEEDDFLEGSRISEYGVCNLMQQHN